MRYFSGEKISELSRLSKRELMENVSLDVDEYIEKHKLFEDGEYKLMIPFKNGEAVKGSIIINDIHVRLKFDENARVTAIRPEWKW